MRCLAMLLSLVMPCAALLKSPRQATQARAELQIPKGKCHVHGVFEGMSKGQFNKLKSFMDHQPYQEEPKKHKVVSKKDAAALQVDANMTDKERKTSSARPLFLRAIGHSYHGTTALSQLIMSSKKVATLCKGETWECEGGKFMVTDKLKEFRRLEIYEKIWDLSKPVFFEKWAISNAEITALMKEIDSGRDAMMNEVDSEPVFFQNRTYRNGDVTSLMKEIGSGVDAMSQTTPMMKAAGIERLDFAFVILWRPLCLMGTSSHTDSHGWQVKQDVDGYKLLLRLYATLVKAKLPVMVVNYGDLLFKPELFERRMYDFAPKLGKLDSNHKVVQGKDVFTCNKWKPQGSVKEFGQSLSASKLHYQPDSGQCSNEKHFEEVEKLLALSRKWTR